MFSSSRTDASPPRDVALVRRFRPTLPSQAPSLRGTQSPRRMIRPLAALVVTLALGVASRLFPIGWPLYDKSLGDVLYAVVVFLMVTLARPRSALRMRAAVALALCLA